MKARQLKEEYYKKGFFWSLKHLDSFKTTFSKELVAGLTTFLTMSYIIIVNPLILTDGTGMKFAGVLTATILVSSISSILMGLYANLPYGLAPGMGLNAFFTYTLVLTKKVSWETALGAVFISGIIFVILSIFKVRRVIVEAIPLSLRKAVAGGIGLFIAFIGFKNAGFIISSPVTFVTLGKFNSGVILFLIGLLITAILILYRVKGGLLLGIIITTLLALPFGRVSLFDHNVLIKFTGNIFTLPDFKSVFLKMNIKGALTLGMIAPIFTFLFTDMFDSISTFVGIAEVADLTDKKGQPINVGKALLVDAISTTISGPLGTSSGTTYIESASGVEEGGRTGLTAVTTGLLFLPFLFFSNVIETIPSFATAPALVIVGVYMMNGIKEINFKDFEEGIPAFLGLILVPLSYSITQGIIWGFLSYTLIKVLRGKAKEIHPMMYIIALFSVLALIAK
ncbi:NCS2 family permease [Candidatus Aerophobetes bacterium]|nr:NCS2 family permease [Candidatus Aerophobetes bacterium]